MGKIIRKAAGKKLFSSLLILILIFAQATECFAVRIETTIEEYPLTSKVETFTQDMWYYDGYWIINPDTDYETKLTDQQISNAINLKGYLKTRDVNFQIKLPREATDAIGFGDNVVCKIESAGTLALSELFDENSLYCTIENGYLHIHGKPLMSFNDRQLSYYLTGLSPSIPIVDYKYGYNLYALHQYLLRSYLSVANILGACDTSSNSKTQINGYFHPSFIINANGQVQNGITVRVNDTPTYLKKDYYIGKKTFPKNKSVGCQFVYPLKLNYVAEHSVTRYYYDDPVVPDPPAVDPPEEPIGPDNPTESEDPNEEGETTEPVVPPLWRIHRIQRYPNKLE